MWIELLGIATGVIGTTAGTTAFIKHRKMPFSERRSIQNVQQVLQAFLEDTIEMKKEPKATYDFFGHRASNFEIHIYVFEDVTKVTLKDTDLNAIENFFDFEYTNKTKELLEVKETSHYYKECGHYDAHHELLKAFIAKVMRTDWRNLEKVEQERLKEKYYVMRPTVTVITEKTPTLESFSWELQQLFDAYISCYEYIKNHHKKLDVETLHTLERDHKHVHTLCESFTALEEDEKTNAFETMKQCMEEKMGILDALIKTLESEALYEFKKITEIMRTNNR